MYQNPSTSLARMAGVCRLSRRLLVSMLYFAFSVAALRWRDSLLAPAGSANCVSGFRNAVSQLVWLNNFDVGCEPCRSKDLFDADPGFCSPILRFFLLLCLVINPKSMKTYWMNTLRVDVRKVDYCYCVLFPFYFVTLLLFFWIAYCTCFVSLNHLHCKVTGLLQNAVHIAMLAHVPHYDSWELWGGHVTPSESSSSLSPHQFSAFTQ